ncbi:segregation/condensation protein A [Enemella dayhoffiae]|uniref:Segregation and condensation protein A n=1 Tax=Enemella dayhoffiae TaxID=2016507 RepID=A0A255H3N5_9ACTN|nr:ScpA family protein [Enemella dayhoffiae]OYO22102.1 segregation/condensation protein A [Enemella dayhoffiae]
MTEAVGAAVDAGAAEVVHRDGFTLRLDNFEGPFDLLLQLIAKHKLDITEVALSRVTNEFIAHVKAGGEVWDLEQTSQFVLVAATLLDLKAARLIPSGEVDDPEDLALLEARDLLFARLLQYRAFKQVSGWLAERLASESLRHPRPGGFEDRYATLLPEVRLDLTPDQLAALAARAMAPKQAVEVSLTHLHAPRVSVVEQAQVVVDRLRRARTLTFRALTGDSPDRVTTVCRFLALLELFRERAVSFEQLTPLGELTVRWTGADSGDLDISAEFDEPPSDGDDDDDQDASAEPVGASAEPVEATHPEEDDD